LAVDGVRRQSVEQRHGAGIPAVGGAKRGRPLQPHLRCGCHILPGKDLRQQYQGGGRIGVCEFLETGGKRFRFHGQRRMSRQNGQRRLRRLQQIRPLQQRGALRHRHIGCGFTRQTGIVGRESGTGLGLRQRRRDEIPLL